MSTVHEFPESESLQPSAADETLACTLRTRHLCAACHAQAARAAWICTVCDARFCEHLIAPDGHCRGCSATRELLLQRIGGQS